MNFLPYICLITCAFFEIHKKVSTYGLQDPYVTSTPYKTVSLSVAIPPNYISPMAFSIHHIFCIYPTPSIQNARLCMVRFESPTNFAPLGPRTFFAASRRYLPKTKEILYFYYGVLRCRSSVLSEFDNTIRI